MGVFEPVCQELDVPLFSCRGYTSQSVLSLNLHRRHLADGQRAMVAVDALPLFEAEERRRELGREAAERQHHPESVVVE